MAKLQNNQADNQDQVTWEEWEIEWWTKNLGITKEQLLNPISTTEVISEEHDFQIS